jgi:alpha-D-xyloside xylohydrolase
MHNLYPLLYNKALFDVTKEETGDGVVWARSAWAGGQRFPLHWGGDNSPNWYNMIPQITFKIEAMGSEKIRIKT